MGRQESSVSMYSSYKRRPHRSHGVRHRWISLVVVVLMCSSTACGDDPQGAKSPELPATVQTSGVQTSGSPGISTHTALPPGPVPSSRDTLHRHMQELTLLLNVRCSSTAPEGLDCTTQAQQIAAVAVAIRQNIETGPDSVRFHEAVQIINRLNSVPQDRMADPSAQQQVLGIGAALQSWLSSSLAQ